jgi:hypothetical protein
LSTHVLRKRKVGEIEKNGAKRAKAIGRTAIATTGPEEDEMTTDLNDSSHRGGTVVTRVNRVRMTTATATGIMTDVPNPLAAIGDGKSRTVAVAPVLMGASLLKPISVSHVGMGAISQTCNFFFSRKLIGTSSTGYSNRFPKRD